MKTCVSLMKVVTSIKELNIALKHVTVKNEYGLLQSTLENSRWSIEHCRQYNMCSGQWDPS